MLRHAQHDNINWHTNRHLRSKFDLDSEARQRFTNASRPQGDVAQDNIAQHDNKPTSGIKIKKLH